MVLKTVLCLAAAAMGQFFAGPMPAQAVTPAVTQATPSVVTPASWLYGKTPEAFPYRVMRSMRRVVVQGAPEKRLRFGVGYDDFTFGTLDGDAWTFDVGFERTQSPWGWGLLSPSQLWDIAGLDDLLQVGAAPYAFTFVGGNVRLDAYAEADVANSDITGIGDDTSYAVGGSATGHFELGDAVTITPVGMFQQYWTGQEDQDDSTTFMVGSQVDVVLGSGFDLDVYGYVTYETQNDDVDDTFWEYGAKLTFTISEGWGVTVGYEASTGAESFDVDRFFVDAQCDF
jgi:hypothetical protein